MDGFLERLMRYIYLNEAMAVNFLQVFRVNFHPYYSGQIKEKTFRGRHIFTYPSDSNTLHSREVTGSSRGVGHYL